MPLILYVEDDLLLQADAAANLSAAGYKVLLAADGAEGCTALRDNSQRVDALITDICLGDAIDGWQVAELGRTINTALPVLYVTASNADEFAGRRVPQSVLFAKPVSWPRIIHSVAALLKH